MVATAVDCTETLVVSARTFRKYTVWHLLSLLALLKLTH